MSEQTAVLGEVCSPWPVEWPDSRQRWKRSRSSLGPRPRHREFAQCEMVDLGVDDRAGNAAVTQDLSHLRKRRSGASISVPGCGADDGPRSFRAQPARSQRAPPRSPLAGRAAHRGDRGEHLPLGRRGRPRRRYAATAAPTSDGRGSCSSVRPLPRTRSPLSSSRCRRGGGRRPRRLVVRGGRAAPRLRNHACRSHGVDHSSPTAPQPARSRPRGRLVPLHRATDGTASPRRGDQPFDQCESQERSQSVDQTLS